MSWAAWAADARKLIEIDRTHRAARQSRIIDRQLVSVGKISRSLTVCFAITIGSLMLLPVDSDVPINVVVITGMMLAFFAPFAASWLKLSEFERLHAPPAGLLLFRLRRLAPHMALIGLIWGAMLCVQNDNGWAIAAIAVMPFAMSLANMLRAQLLAYAMRVAITVTFLLGWIGVVDWLPMVTLGLDLAVVMWFVRDLGVYDRDGFAIEYVPVDAGKALYAEIAPGMPLPDVRASKRRSLLGSAVLLSLSGMRGTASFWRRRPLAVTLSSLLFVVWSLAPVWLAALAVWQSLDGIAAVYCVPAVLFSMSHLFIEASDQLYLWGVDMRHLQRHNVCMRLLTAVLPSVAAAAITVVLLGESDARWITVCLLLGLHLARIGLGAFNFITALLLLFGFGVGLIVLDAGTAMEPNKAFYAAVVFAVFGIIGITIQMFPGENALRRA